MTRLPSAVDRRLVARRPGRAPRRLHLHDLEDRSVPAVFTVTTTADAGAGSLRQAILDANAAGGADVINFDTAGTFSTPRTIDITSAALPTIEDDLTIAGPGAANLTVRRGAGAPEFRILNSYAGSLTLTDFTVTGGLLTDDSGAGLRAGGTVLLDRMVFSGNQTTGGFGGGGAVAVGGPTTLTIRDSTISGNTATGSGGGIYFFAYPSAGSILVENSTISGNTAQAAAGGEPSYGGGGIYFVGRANEFVIRNSTIAANTSAGSGGGIEVLYFDGTILVQNSTITGNTAATTATYYGGGGIATVVYSAGTVELVNSILSGNTNANGPDVYTDYQTMTVEATFSALGSTTGIINFTNGPGNLPVGANLMLGTLAPNGGPTQTLVPQTGSPLINAGSTALVPAGVPFDQRGLGYVRAFGGTVDIGAVEVQPPGLPVAVASAPGVGSADEGEATYTFTVRYADLTGPAAGQGLNLSSIVNNSAAVRVTGPNGFSAPATFVGISPSASLNDRTVTYTITPPGGAWDRTDNGPYTVVVQPNQVFDIDGNPVAGGPIGGFNVAILNFVVQNTDDAGFGSLRQVLTDANLDPGPNTVTFDPAVFGTTPRTITLQTALPDISEAGGDLTFAGPGSDLLTVRRAATATPFRILTSFNHALTLDGVTITGGVSDGPGGGILLGGYYSINYLTDVVVSGNTAAGSGGGIGGGIISFLSLAESTVSGNTSAASGGGIYFYNSGGLTVVNSTISGNTATGTGASYGGGGIFFRGYTEYYAPPGFELATAVIRNSTIANNTTTGSGGGVGLNFFRGTLSVENSTVSGNVAADAGSGGGLALIAPGSPGTFAALNIVNSVVSGNTNVNAPDISSGYDVIVNSSAVGDLDNLQGFTITSGVGNIDVNNFADLLLTPLGDYGGPTQTFGVRLGSPLIDAGDLAAVDPGITTDQRGGDFVRVFGAGVDIGSFENQPTGVTVTAGPGQADPTGSATILFTVTFDAPATGFDDPLTDVVLSGTAGATTAVITPVSGQVYTVGVSGMTTSGTVTLTIPAGAATDIFGGPNLASAGGDDTITYDNVVPTVTINQAAGQPDPTTVGPVRFTLQFSEPVTGFDLSDVTNGGTLGGTPTIALTPVDPLTYTLTYTNLVGEGTIVPVIAAGAYADVAGNAGAVSTGTDGSVTFDALGPRVTINQGAGQGDPTNSTSIVFDVVFSEPVADFTVADVDLSGSTNGGAGLTPVVAGTGTTYTVTVTGMVNNDVVVATVLGGGTTDALGNVGFASTSTDNTVKFDNQAPTVTINQAAGQADPTTAEPVLFTAEFSEPAAGFSAADVVFTGTAAGAVATVTQVGPTTWTISVSGMTGTGTVIPTLPGANYTDLAGNQGANSTSTDNSVQFNYGGSFVLDSATYAVDENGTSLVITVSRTGGTEGSASVSYSTGGGTATPGTDYTTTTGTLTFAAGVSGNQTFTIPILDDRVIELGPDTFNVTLSNPTNATATVRLGTPSTATVTITDIEEGRFDFSQPVFDTDEINGTATITVTRSNGASGAVDLNYTVLARVLGAHAGGAAATGQDDFVPVPAGLLHFADGQTTGTFEVTIKGDTFNEGREKIALALTGVSGNAILGPTVAANLVIGADDGTALTPKGVVTTDGDGDTATLKLSSGTGTFFRDDPDGDGKGGIDLIEVSGTTDAASALSVAVKKLKDNLTPDAGKIAIGGITGTGLKSISAKAAYLTIDGVLLTGHLGALTVGDILNGADITTGNTTNPKATATKITAGVIGDGTAITVGGAAGTTGKGIGALTATRIGVGSIAAASIGSITTKGATKPTAVAGDLGSPVTVSGAGLAAGKLALGKVTVAGAILASADITAPSAGPISARGDLAADIAVTGPISSIKAATVTGSTIAANSLGSLSAVGKAKTATTAAVPGDVTGLTLTLLGANVPDTRAVLGTFSAKGTVSNSDVQVFGNVTKLSALNFRGSNFYVGFDGDEAGVGTFEPVATLKTVSITGATDAYQDSNIIASTIGSVTFKSVDATNGGTKFGVISNTTIKSLKVTTPAFAYNPFFLGTQGLNPDFEVRLV